MHRLVKFTLITLGTLLGIALAAWLGVAAYVSTHRKQVLQTITAQLNENITGELTIQSMEPSLLQGFPGVSVSLNNVLLRDSLYHIHKHNLLKAKEIFIAVNTLSIIMGKPQIQNISVNDGEVYLYTDSSGYSNTRLFKPSTDGNTGSGKKKRRINRINFSNVHLTFENKLNKKLFDFDIQQFAGKIKYKTNSWSANVVLNTKVNSLVFNAKKGSFIQQKVFRTELNLTYNHKIHLLKIPLQNIWLDDDMIKAGGDFSFAPSRPNFTLNLKAKNIPYKNALALLAPQIASKLRIYNLKKPLSAEAIIKGKLKGKDLPLVIATWNVTNNNALTYSGETITNCNFTGRFTNEFEHGKPRKDPNSAVSFYQFTGMWLGIPFKSDTLTVTNLQKPVLQGQFKSSFPLSKLNAISGSDIFYISKGYANLDLLYKAPFSSSSTIEPYLYGTVNIRNAELNYLPRNLKFKQVNGLINFKGQDLFLKNMQVQSIFSKLLMQGSIHNFVNFYYTDPKKILLDWHVQSDQINLGEFLAFLGTRKNANPNTSKTKTRGFFKQLNNVLDEASVKIDLTAKRLIYKRFTAEHVKSNLALNQSGIHINNVSLNHAGGSLSIKGKLNQTAAVNQFNLDTRLVNVDIQKLFFAFEDFGQTGISYENIRGKLTASTIVRGLLKNNGQLVSKSFFGKVNFDLKQGVLLNFEPMQKIGKIAFHNRNFSTITFADLKNTLDVQGDKIIIPKMVIQSSVINMILEGVYGIPTGTDIAMEIPIRNPEKDKSLPDSLKEKRMLRGIVINLNAKDDENGQVKIKLGKGKKDEEDDKKQEKDKIPADSIKNKKISMKREKEKS